MKITDLFKPNSAQTSQNAAQKAAERKPAADAPAQQQTSNAAGSGQDTVQISPLARQFAQVSRILADDEGSRAAKVADIKARVEKGEYNVDSKDVAESLVAFVQDV